MAHPNDNARQCNVYYWDSQFMIQAFDKAITGLTFGGSLQKCSLEEGSLVLGNKVIESLDANQFGVPMPEMRPGKLPESVKFSGFKSNRAFESAVEAACMISELHEGLFVARIKQSKPSGFSTLWKERVLSERDPAILGKTVFTILNLEE